MKRRYYSIIAFLLSSMLPWVGVSAKSYSIEEEARANQLDAYARMSGNDSEVAASPEAESGVDLQKPNKKSSGGKKKAKKSKRPKNIDKKPSPKYYGPKPSPDNRKYDVSKGKKNRQESDKK